MVPMNDMALSALVWVAALVHRDWFSTTSSMMTRCGLDGHTDLH